MPIEKRDLGLYAGIREEEGGYTLAGKDIQDGLQGIQGNILSWHNRRNAHYFFVDFKAAVPAEVRATRHLLRLFAVGADQADAVSLERLRPLFPEGREIGRDIADALGGIRLTAEFDLREEYRMARRPPGAPAVSLPGSYFLSVLLTSPGYAALGFGKNDPVHPRSEAFRQGMAERKMLRDTGSDGWELLRAPAHALIILAYNPTAREIDRTVKAFRSLLEICFDRICSEEAGMALESQSVDPDTGKRWFHDPIGYRDGISQPLFYQEDTGNRRDREALNRLERGASGRWNPAAALGLVLAEDPGGGPDAYGSYFVYRKLQEDLFAFYEMIENLGVKFQNNRELAFAWIMGRYPDGTPLAAGALGPARNDFNYRNDKAGAVCPFHAHIRKVNPRSESPIDGGADVRIVRRALSFGPILAGRCAPNEGRLENTLLGETWRRLRDSQEKFGLHFMCAQSDIEAQFEQIQGGWANVPRSSNYGNEKDAVIGQPEAEARTIGIPEAVGDMPSSRSRFALANFVKLLGGAYFFAPSIPFFRNLDGIGS